MELEVLRLLLAEEGLARKCTCGRVCSSHTPGIWSVSAVVVTRPCHGRSDGSIPSQAVGSVSQRIKVGCSALAIKDG